MTSLFLQTHDESAETVTGRYDSELLSRANKGTKKADMSDVSLQEAFNHMDMVKSNVSAAMEHCKQETMEAKRNLRESENRLAASQQEVRTLIAENERQVRALERNLFENVSRLGQEVRQQNERAIRAEESLRRIEREYEELRRRSLAENEEAGRRLVECEQRLQQLENQWVVRRNEIEFTGQELGHGGWATVKVAIFRNVQVAAKSIHRQILSPHNIELFRREMNMAARIRHPNLVQFIGATVELDEEMMILTELMPTSLRRELQREYMPPSEVISIGLDVARALNYLHRMKPDSIIHRDVSSANVLLEYKSRNRWKAKLSDYGSVNLLNQLQTENPGNPVYSAPEANDPSQQSPKMDIFSFGALLLEMLTGVLPARELRERLLGRIHHEQLLDLIRRCLMERKEERPNASDIIIELERYASRH